MLLWGLIWLLWGLVWLVLMAGKRSLWELISLLWLIWLVELAIPLVDRTKNSHRQILSVSALPAIKIYHRHYPVERAAGAKNMSGPPLLQAQARKEILRA